METENEIDGLKSQALIVAEYLLFYCNNGKDFEKVAEMWAKIANNEFSVEFLTELVRMGEKVLIPMSLADLQKTEVIVKTNKAKKAPAKKQKAERKTRSIKTSVSHKQEKKKQGYVDYYDYIASKEWKDKRRQKIIAAGGTCELCGSGINLAVHHLTYEHLGNEPLEDLLLVCNRCHEKIHTVDLARKKKK